MAMYQVCFVNSILRFDIDSLIPFPMFGDWQLILGYGKCLTDALINSCRFGLDLRCQSVKAILLYMAFV